MRPTKLAVLIFLLGGALVVLPIALDPVYWTYWAAFLFLATLLLGTDWILGPRLRRLKITLTTPSQLFVNADHQAGLSFENPSRRKYLLRLKVDVSPELEEIPGLHQVSIGFNQNTVPIRLHATRRGQAKIEAVWLNSSGPLGLTTFSRYVPLGIVRPVTPNLQAVSRQAIQFFTTRNFQFGVRVERFRGDGTDFDHLREYVPGFDIRNIDWKASARHAKLLCREFRAERNRQVILAIDSGRLMNEPLEGVPRLDHAIHSALVLAYVSLHVGDRVGLVSFAERLNQYCEPVKGRTAFGELSKLASLIEYSSQETNFTLGLMELARRHIRRALIVVLTDFVDTITAELMIENLSRLARQHLVIFVALQDPLLRSQAEQEPSVVLNLQKSLVAYRLLQERELVIRRLRRLGISCIDSPPSGVSTRLIDRYLEVKRKEAF